jgi:hypothetical protein
MNIDMSAAHVLNCLISDRSDGTNCKIEIKINKPESQKQQNKNISYKYGVKYASIEMSFLKHRMLHASLSNYD